jgi:hypothetical protein
MMVARKYDARFSVKKIEKTGTRQSARAAVPRLSTTTGRTSGGGLDATERVPTAAAHISAVSKQAKGNRRAIRLAVRNPVKGYFVRERATR